MACLGRYSPSPSWGGTARKARRVGESRASTNRARALRKTLTPQEARLWVHLRALRAQGFHFRRQAPLLGFYLDFVCFSRKLIVEADGGQHADGAQESHDFIRDDILRKAGFRTLRFWNSDINTNFDAVMDAIWMALAGPHSPTLAASPPVPPHEGEGKK
ncbi:MAG: endonuclease domain-containing protein [Caulobacterales bacterium]